MVVSRDNDSTAKPDSIGVCSEPREDLKGVWCNGHFYTVVLGCPDDLKATSICHLDHLQSVLGDCLHVGCRRHTFHVDDELKFHMLVI